MANLKPWIYYFIVCCHKNEPAGKQNQNEDMNMLTLTEVIESSYLGQRSHSLQNFV